MSIFIRKLNRWEFVVIIHTEGLRIMWRGFEKRRLALAFVAQELDIVERIA